MKREHFYYIITLFCAWIFLGSVFIHKYGPSFDKLPFHDDYLETYCMSIKGVEMLFEGGIFGWDSNHLGGYPVVYTGTTMLSFLILPFFLLSKSCAFQLMLLCLWLAFPVSASILTHTIFNNWKVTIATLILATCAFLFYLWSVLRYGNIHNFSGVVVFSVCLIFYEKIRQGRAFAYFWCVFSASLLYFTYFPFAIFFMSFILIHWLAKPTKREFLAILFIGISLFLITLQYNWFYLIYHNYATHSFINYHPAITYRPIHEIGPYLFSSFRSHFISGAGWRNYFFIFIAPLYLFGLFNKKLKPYSLILLFIIAIYFLAPALFESDWIKRILPHRIIYLMPIFAVVHFAYALGNLPYFRFKIALHLLVILLSLLILKPYHFEIATPISTMRDYNDELYENIVKLDGNLVLFENVSIRNLLNDKDDPRFRKIGAHTHKASLMARDTGKNLFSSTHEGWHETVFRGNCINSGVFRGKHILDVKISEMEAVLKKWGIVYLVVWNDYTKQYFSSFKEKFDLPWHDHKWSIFVYKNADGRSVKMAAGEGWIARETYFSKEIQLRDASKGETIIVRSNYFPAWKAFYDGVNIPTLDIDGQLGFTAPADGSYGIRLQFPRYPALNILSLMTLFLAIILSNNRRFKSLIAR